MPHEAALAWDAPLQQLLVSRVLDGYGLLDHTGKCLASFGSLSTELWCGGSSNSSSDRKLVAATAAATGGEDLPPAARQLLMLFNSSELRGRKLQ